MARKSSKQTGGEVFTALLLAWMAWSAVTYLAPLPDGWAWLAAGLVLGMYARGWLHKLAVAARAEGRR